jgi:DNA-binding transcriptional MerR regulator
MFKVGPDTIRRWEKQGLLSASRTLGNHRRFDAGEVRRLRGAQLRSKIAGHPHPLLNDQGDENGTDTAPEGAA